MRTIAFLIGLWAASHAGAFDLNTMSEEERAQFRAEIRAYLLENPEIIMEAVTVLEQREAQQQANDDATLVQVNSEALFSDEHSWVGGNPDGDITLVEFVDYRCHYCRRAFDEIKGLLAADGNIRFVIKEFPILGEDSLTSARFAIATKHIAGDDAYKIMHDVLIEYDGPYSDAGLSRLAESFGFDAQGIIDHMDSEEVSTIISQNHALGQRMQISGTPSFVMQNRMLRGYLPQDAMQQLAAEIRAEG